MRAAPGVDAAMPDANEAKAFIAESGRCWHTNFDCRHLKGKLVRNLACLPRGRQLCGDCTDAARAGAAHFASLLQHVDRMHGATATEAVFISVKVRFMTFGSS